MSNADTSHLDSLTLQEELEDTQEGKFLTFHLCGEEYGIEIRYVKEINGIQKITDLPEVPAFVKGVINLRGKVIPVIDVRLRFGMEEREYDERTCIVVVEIQETATGLIVDEVSEVIDIPEENIEPPPRVGASVSSRYIKGLGKVNDTVKILLDVQRLMLEDELEMIADSVPEE